tara:strand:+ start:300 stop:845 length:546 start_codon:yes stop_codon:yes gene_type:complete
MDSNNIEKLIITAQELIDDSFKLGIKVFESGYQPTTIITLWRGGATVGIVIDELMSYKNIITNHNVLRTSSYKNTEQLSSVKIFGLDSILERFEKKEKILIIDDIFDSGNTIDTVINAINEKHSCFIKDIRIAVPWFKPENNKTLISPDYYLHETDKWIVFPHELESLSKDEIIKYRSSII